MSDWLELFGVASALLYIYLEIKQRSSMWIVGFVSSLVYVLVFFQSALYALSALYAYYTVISVYGMYCWQFAKNANEGNRPVTRLNMRTGITLACISFVLWTGIGLILNKYIDVANPMPYSEALITALSIVATWMLAKKILEHWIVWIFVNFFSSILYFNNELYPTAALFVVYGALSIAGWIRWKK